VIYTHLTHGTQDMSARSDTPMLARGEVEGREVRPGLCVSILSGVWGWQEMDLGDLGAGDGLW
jgi:hypothetical protein